MNENPLISTVAIPNAANEDKFSGYFHEQNELSNVLRQKSPEKCFNSVKQEEFVVPDNVTDIAKSKTTPESFIDHEKQNEVENIEIKIHPNDFPLAEVDEKTTPYDHIAVDDSECADPLGDTDESGNLCNEFYPASMKFHCPPEQELPRISQFECNYCSRVFVREDLLENHLFTHSCKQYICDRCGKFFKRREDFIAHERSHVSNAKCVRCCKTFDEKAAYESHLQKQNILNCPQCDLHFFTECTLNCHLLSHARDNKNDTSAIRHFECDRCNETSTSVIALREHYQIHSTAKPFKCEYCSFLFTNSHSLKRHVKKNTCPDILGKPTKSTCGKCGETYIARCRLLIHELEVHGIFSKLITLVPNKQLRTVDTTSLPISKSADTREEGKQSNHATIRKRNQNTVHSEENQCIWCGQQFSTKDCLDQHERIVHRNSKNVIARNLKYATLTEQLKNLPKPYHCPWCGRRDDARVGFIEHYLTHTKEKPFACDICGMGFIRACQLRQHCVSHASLRKNVDTNKRTAGEINAKNSVNRKGLLHNTGTKRSARISWKNVAASDARNFKEAVVPKREAARPVVNSSCRAFYNSDTVPSEEIEFSREAIVKLMKLNYSLVQDTVYVCNICYKFFALPVSLLGHRKTCIYKYRLRLEQSKKLMPSTSENKILQKKNLSANGVFVDRFGIQHSIIFESGRRFFKCGKCVRKFGRKDRLIRHSETHCITGTRQVSSNAGPLAKKSTTYRLTYSKPSNANVTVGLTALGDFFHGSRIPDGLDITICENKTDSETKYSSLKCEETDQYMEADFDFDSDDISLFEPQCIVKDENSDMEDNIDFCSNDNNKSESSAHHFLDIDMSQDDYNSSVEKSDYNSDLDIRNYAINSGEVDYECKAELNPVHNAGNSLSDFSSVENVVTLENDIWICAQCNTTFARKYDLMQHYSVHKGETSFKCVYCDKEFTKRKYLTRHARRHIKKMKNCCSRCEECFDTVTELENHDCAQAVQFSEVC